MATKVTKTQLIDILADKLGISKTKAEEYLNVFIEVIVENLKKDIIVAITGFGIFSKVNRKARNGINPKTGEKIKIPASVSASFKPGKNLKENIA
jgi:DNA-binding protein HU-beta